jgi:dihydropteroate synthase
VARMFEIKPNVEPICINCGQCANVCPTEAIHEKFDYKNIKIYNLSPAQANIIKQTALSIGADCATHRDVITGKIEKSDCILGGSVSQLKKIAEKLKFQPFGLKTLGEKLLTTEVSPKNGCKIVGILNITENSFSDGGLYNDFENAKSHLLEMINDGADIIDIGAESTKPYSSSVDEKTQLEKLLPIIDFAKDKATLSVDTRSSQVAEECLKAGAKIINDVSGFDYDKKMPDIIAKYNCPIVIQHSKGTPENMQDTPKYEDVIEEIYLELYRKCEFAKSKGIENIIIDPGIGFGKNRENNFEIIRRVEEFKSLGYPVMLGISRKSFLNLEDNLERDIFTTAINALATERNVDYIRVHNVKMHKTLIDLMKMFMVE